MRSPLMALAVLMLSWAGPVHGEDGRRTSPSATLVLNQFLSETEAGTLVALADLLETYTLTEEQVRELLRAAQVETSEERKIILWHALRCSRSRAAREYLLRNVAEDSEPSLQVRFVQSLTQPTPFDVPILCALYQRPAPAAEEALSLRKPDEPSLPDEIVKLATRDLDDLSPRLRLPPQFATPDGGLGPVNDLRQRRAQQAKTDLLVWLAKNAASEAHRLTAVDAALECLEGEHQKRFAKDVLALSKDPDSRANLIPRLLRRYAFDAFPLLVDERETEATKLGVLRGLHMFASSYGYSLSTLDHGQETLQYVAQTDDSDKVREAARRLLRRIDGTALEESPEPER